MPFDFDPLKIPKQLVCWFQTAPEAERERASTEFGKRAIAALHVLKGVEELRAALAKVDDSRLPGAIRELIKVARDLHDYDPTSD